MRSFIAIAVALLAASAVHAVPRPQTSGVTTLAKGDKCSTKSTTAVCGTGLICGKNPAYVKGGTAPCHVCIDDPNYVASAADEAAGDYGEEEITVDASSAAPAAITDAATTDASATPAATDAAVTDTAATDAGPVPLAGAEDYEDPSLAPETAAPAATAAAAPADIKTTEPAATSAAPATTDSATTDSEPAIPELPALPSAGSSTPAGGPSIPAAPEGF